jgi:dephospho-CoA kinase
MKRSARIGVTGKLGSGKSVLLKLMAEHASPTMRFAAIRSDDLARELMERDPTLRTELTEILGPKAYANGMLDRAYIASQIFHDKSLLAKVESAVHPAVTREVEKVFQLNSTGVVAVESALILKSKFREVFDYIVLVESPVQASIERVVKQGRLTRAEAEARLAEQDFDQQSRDEADFFIENAGSAEAFEEKCRKLIALLEPLCDRELPDEPLHA